MPYRSRNRRRSLGKRPRKIALTVELGKEVLVRFCGRRLPARIVEDRGPIGLNGRQLVRIELTGQTDAPEQTFEVPAEDLSPR